ncbi:3-keto-disaccharide hydrolase [Adhaeretor mobilis]|uniref:3-keto-alpha-glucoside-1,2-lyase/3-keto-2-hydroxy-glucal hydratase domain-containing protein n=1 Tax=Adhaeretor mobilis TaxID=1930276 RepID=A0A517N0E5_9BACT|nr:DUF1080 domain-containing protein [Adhaeretor mobilis]QDT00601.1 hypothetical protein HG15A2_39400 [Adhaeretor mobilis]
MKTLALVHLAISCFVTLPLNAKEPAAEDKATQNWITMFDGKTFDGWKANEMADGWKIEDGTIRTAPGRSHLFYTASDFTDFEFKAEVKTTPGSNSGIYFHTKWQDKGWPKHGHESQVNQTHTDPVKSGSLYNVVKLYESPAKDGQWYEHRIVVKGNNIRVHINGKLAHDYTEPNGVTDERRLSKGTIALQSHDPKSVVYYRNLRIRPLGDEEASQ